MLELINADGESTTTVASSNGGGDPPVVARSGQADQARLGARYPAFVCSAADTEAVYSCCPMFRSRKHAGAPANTRLRGGPTW